ncbi:tripartite tricarboxylate transporter substrate-binding protein [Hansschlegelia zhihuaiae]|uniref:Tripartite tricarboxylate transporter substrate binding protein n=1 Tax=Hansschlegelia zhihuaiae TaxID=405005 RepID=A0A4Q0MMB4_9HYPH|nr:tripartite tricarboxylate transporter substrate-binding protein [Hansschlegelia zhihuaiae]RXF74605.1 tripartite tricarboxylate transporter substrate binding protein [Hansschlegelia zhihuaiae]
MTGADRRSVSSGLAAALVAASAPAAAQTAAVEVLAAGSAGEGDDQLARAVAEGLNATRLVPRATAVNVPRETMAISDFIDGRRPRASLMVISLSTVGALAISGHDKYLNSVRPIARLVGEHQPIVVPAASPFGTLADLMAALRRDPSSVGWTGRPYGSADHQLALLLTSAAGADPRGLAYRPVDTSARAALDALTGAATVASGALGEFRHQMRGGTLRALALASPARAPGVDAPTLREQGVDITMMNWRGVVSRGAVGPTLLGRFDEAIDRLVQVSGWRQLLAQRSWEDLYEPAEPFRRFIQDERARVGALMARRGPS